MFWTKYADLCFSRGEAPNVVAAKIGVKSSGTVSGWKKGAMPRDGALSAIANYFDVPVSYFFEDENKPAPIGNELDELYQSIIEKISGMTLEQMHEIGIYVDFINSRDK